MVKQKHIIFDLDGTLIDSKAEIIATYQKVLSQIPSALNVNLNEIDFGAKLNEVLLFIYGEDLKKINLARTLFAKHYDNSDFLATTIYPSVFETLTKLKGKHYNLYIATNKRFTSTLKILDKKNLSSFFKDIMANEMEEGVSISKSEMIAYLIKKHSIHEGFMVGDTLGDIVAGNKNGLKTIAVTYGYESETELITVNPSFVINSFEKLIKFVS